jgi:hypothetical protein
VLTSFLSSSLTAHKEAIRTILSPEMDLSIDAEQGTLTRELEMKIRSVAERFSQ